MIFLKTALVLACVFLKNIVMHKPHKIYDYLWFGITSFFVLFLINFAYGTDYVPDSRIEIETIEFFIKSKGLNDKQKQEYQRKRDYHYNEALRCFQIAQDKCWYLPTVEDKKMAEYCFTTFVILIGPGEPMSKGIMALLNLVGQYGLNCIAEWHDIEIYLNSAKYHYEMYEFYSDVLEGKPRGVQLK